MTFPISLRSRLLNFLMVGACSVELFAATGCVVYPNGQVGVIPVTVVPAGPPVVNVGYYGRPAGYYYRENPVYIYNGRNCYYNGGRRYWYGGGRHYYYNRGYRHYY